MRKGHYHPKRRYEPEIDWDEVYADDDEDNIIDPMFEGDDDV